MSEALGKWALAYRDWESWGTDFGSLVAAGEALVKEVKELQESQKAAMDAVAIWRERALIAEAQVQTLNHTVSELLAVTA